MILFILELAFANSEPNMKEPKNAENVNELDMKVLVDEAHDWAHKVGMIWRAPATKDRSDVAAVIPASLYPTPFPRKIFQQAYDLQKWMTLLYYRAACDYEFLVEALTEVAKSDPTIGLWLEVLKQVHAEGRKQQITMVFQRCDYMCHVNKDVDTDVQQQYELKQIEVNNGAPAGIIAEKVTLLHQRMLAKAGIVPGDMLPNNQIIKTLTDGLYLAWQKFGNPDAIMLMITTTSNQHMFEKRYVEYELDRLSKGKMRTFYITQLESAERLHLTDDLTLMLDDHVVGVVFFRLTYILTAETLKMYNLLDTRVMIERSTAIKCPPIEMIMTGSKKFQQIMAKPGNVERFFRDQEDAPIVRAIRATFAGLWGLGKEDEEADAIIQEAIEHPDRFVLKPNREGGGHNIWGQEIADNLRTFSPDDRAKHILMQRLDPFEAKAFFLRDDREPVFGRVNSELSTYGVLVGKMTDGTVLHNASGGHVYRSKSVDVNEGGITVGTGVYDSPLLI